MKERRKGATFGLRGLWSQWSERGCQPINRSIMHHSVSRLCLLCVYLSLVARSKERAEGGDFKAGSISRPRRGGDNDKRKGVERTEGSANADSGCHQAAKSAGGGYFGIWGACWLWVCIYKSRIPRRIRPGLSLCGCVLQLKPLATGLLLVCVLCFVLARTPTSGALDMAPHTRTPDPSAPGDL